MLKVIETITTRYEYDIDFESKELIELWLKNEMPLITLIQGNISRDVIDRKWEVKEIKEED